jgi:hypothetical protein
MEFGTTGVRRCDRATMLLASAPFCIADIRNGRHSHRRMKAAPKNDDPTRFLPIGVRKSYFLLSKVDRDVLNIALGKYQLAKSEPILVGDARLLKSALRLLTLYRLRIDEIRDGKAVMIYTRWLEGVQVKDESVSVTLNSAESQRKRQTIKGRSKALKSSTGQARTKRRIK